MLRFVAAPLGLVTKSATQGGKSHLLNLQWSIPHYVIPTCSNPLMVVKVTSFLCSFGSHRQNDRFVVLRYRCITVDSARLIRSNSLVKFSNFCMNGFSVNNHIWNGIKIIETNKGIKKQAKLWGKKKKCSKRQLLTWMLFTIDSYSSVLLKPGEINPRGWLSFNTHNVTQWKFEPGWNTWGRHFLKFTV